MGDNDSVNATWMTYSDNLPLTGTLHNVRKLCTVAHTLLSHRPLPFPRCLHHLPAPGLHPYKQPVPHLHRKRHLTEQICLRFLDPSGPEGHCSNPAHRVCPVALKPHLRVDVQRLGHFLQLLLLSRRSSAALTEKVHPSIQPKTVCRFIQGPRRLGDYTFGSKVSPPCSRHK